MQRIGSRFRAWQKVRNARRFETSRAQPRYKIRKRFIHRAFGRRPVARQVTQHNRAPARLTENALLHLLRRQIGGHDFIAAAF